MKVRGHSCKARGREGQGERENGGGEGGRGREEGEPPREGMREGRRCVRGEIRGRETRGVGSYGMFEGRVRPGCGRRRAMVFKGRKGGRARIRGAGGLGSVFEGKR